MPCFYPLEATRSVDGKITIHKRHQARQATPAHMGRDFKLPCGKCIGCKMEHGRQWAVRCLHESQTAKRNCALTLTYSDDPNYEAVANEDRVYPHQDMWIARKSARELPTIAPEGLRGPKIAHVDNSRSEEEKEKKGRREVISLSKGDHQKFMKRLRKEIGPVRYYMCGEYGERLARPHYHYLIFGYDFPDKTYFKKSLSGTTLYRSPTLEKIWTFGHAWIGDVDFSTCAYVASYITKKITGEMAEDHYRRTDEAGNDFWLLPEFNYMSRRPGIAKTWWQNFHQDVTASDAVVINTRKAKPPRYYDKLLELMDPVKWGLTKLDREVKALKQVGDNTPDRLATKELVQRARMNLKTRRLEK